jgi:Tfp pilus assembly protein PilF
MAQPPGIDALLRRAAAQQQAGRCAEALEACDTALRRAPSHPEALHGRAVALAALGRREEALAEFARVVRLRPGNAQAIHNHAATLHHLGRFAEALAGFEEAVRLSPAYAEAWFNRGNALRALERHDDALDAYAEAVRLRPGYADALLNRSTLLQDRGRFAEAMEGYLAALQARPDFPGAAWNLSLLLLLQGAYRDGWRLYESRLLEPGLRDGYPRLPVPAWRGDADLRGRTLLVHAEQGLGDVLQFARYVPLLRARGVSVVFGVHKALVPLMATGLAGPEVTVVTDGDPLPPVDASCPVMSLPLAFGTTLETVPWTGPYLRADAAKVAAWHERLGPPGRLRVGVVWSGRAEHRNDRNRSLALQQLLPLLALPVEWHSLQREYRPADEVLLRDTPAIRQHQDHLRDFSDTAALAACLDVVLTVDTSVAHLAGALGRPVWILLPHVPDFRWLLEREDSPWYPTARLFRQPAPGQWAPVLARVRRELALLRNRGGRG